MTRCFVIFVAYLSIFLPDRVISLVPYTGRIIPGFEGFQSNYIKNGGLFLNSLNAAFGFGFSPTQASVNLFTLSVVHRSSSRVIWSANRALPLSISGKFDFETSGTVVLRREEGGSVVWRLDNSGKNVSRIELHDSGNLVVVSGDGAYIWESFDHPTDTLITNQAFNQGMKLTSNPPSSSNMTYALEMTSGDVLLSVNSLTPQVYWSMGNDRGKIINQNAGVVTSSSLLGNTWRFFNEKEALLWQFVFSDNKDDNATWIAVLGNNGVITFSNLGSGVSVADSSTKIPSDQCATPEPCGSYYVCSGSKVCGCVSGLSRARSDCKSGITSPCKKPDNAMLSVELVNAGDGVDYFALGFASPFSKKTTLDRCKEFCNSNCSCLGLFFQNSSGDCFLFDWIGSFKNSGNGGSGFVSYLKVVAHDGKHFPYIVIIVPVVVISVFLVVAFWIHRRKKAPLASAQENSERDSFVNTLPSKPIQFSYEELVSATSNFSEKLGHGGFGSVYKGTLPDGSHIAVKKLEGILQGKKEFKAEVSTLGSIHHLNLVQLRGFCAEGDHRLLAYEFLANGSLERWIFRRRDGDILLDWETRFNIALGTAKGLAYLHEDCDARIIHCDIKPANILIDDNFLAKISDFGMVKHMNRDQSHDFTNPRGTTGYLDPKWLISHEISEKCDVYSYGMVLIELIRGRRNQESGFNFPNDAIKKLKEGMLLENVDWLMEDVDVNEERVQRAMKTAFSCIQEDGHLRPSMKKVVQMLEGVIPVALPLSLYPNHNTRSSLMPIREECSGTSSVYNIERKTWPLTQKTEQKRVKLKPLRDKGKAKMGHENIEAQCQSEASSSSSSPPPRQHLQRSLYDDEEKNRNLNTRSSLMPIREECSATSSVYNSELSGPR